MISVYMFHEVRKLRSSGMSRAAIARKLGINPKTVAKYIASNTPPKYKPRTASTRGDPFGRFVDKVHEWLNRTPGLTDQEIYEFLIPEGYKGSERTLNRRMKKIRQAQPQERFFEQEYEPAEQAQFDFKELVELPFVEGVRVVHLHFGTLPFSDTCRVRGYPFKNYECFMDGIHSFFEGLGGMTDGIRFDNLSPVVKEVLKGNNRLYTDAFNRSAVYYGFKLLPCTPGKGSDKGDVERDIRTYASRIKKRVSHDSVVFRDWQHLNEWLLAYMLERETEGTKARRTKEQAILNPLPPREDGILCKIQLGPASSHGVIRIGKSAYSVPDTLIGVGCKTVIGAYDVKISRIAAEYGDTTIIIHPRKPDGEHSLPLEHVLPSLVRKPQAMVRWAHRDILFPHPTCQAFYNRLKQIEGYGAEREYLRAFNLVHHVCLSEIITGMELILEIESHKMFEDLRDLLLGERRPSPVIDITSRLNQSPLQPELSEYDCLIPKKQGASL
jgi:transposase